MDIGAAKTVCQGCHIYWFKLKMWHMGSSTTETTTVDRIQAAAAAGCPCCRVVADGLAVVTPAWAAKVRSHTMSVLLCPNSLAIRLRGRDSTGVLNIYGHADGPSFNNQFAFALRSKVVANTKSEDAFRSANKWLEACVKNHTGCAQPFFSATPNSKATSSPADAFVPTRVLDVGGSDSARISLVQNAPAGSPYIALSYCWGPDPSGTVTTKKGNVAAHMDPQRGIELPTLPRTIQDAVLVCRRLHVRYLWIDALCIVQDDGDDWRREAAQMCNVYQRSHVTIAAHRASACQHGFLGPQEFGKDEHQRVFWTEEIGRENGDATARRKAKMILRAEYKQIRSLPTAPLGSRGWTLQEVVLPRRILHFFEYEMAWECQTTHHCECGETTGFEAPHLPMLGRSLRSLDDDITKKTSSSSSDGGRSVIAKLNWMSLVEQYSRRSLTRLSDKLIAMDGLARMVEGTIMSSQGGAPVSRLPPLSLDNTVIRTAYVEGLFVADFAQQLMWGVSQNSLASSTPPPSPPSSPPQPTTRRQSRDLHAPSWSWASIDAPVGYSMIYSEDTESLLHVHDFRPHTIVNPNANVTGVTLTATVVPAAVRTMAPADTITGQGGPASRARPLVFRPNIVRACNGFSYSVFCDDVQTPDLFMESPDLPCWVADDSMHNTRVRQRWLITNGSATDVDTDNGLTRSCQHNRGRHIRQIVDEEDEPGRTTKERWCSTCRVWPSDDVAWQDIDSNIMAKAKPHTTLVPRLSMLMQVFRRREAGSHTVYFLALRPSAKVPGAWERFGHGHYVTWDKASPHVDLFWGSKVRDLLLV
ncbi:hypothetical protein SPBR_05652 [Sporothrix brasiliensis 5110]|uniref:Heterokaryon incompatibility domain-containing protein n=1 Tax=Sporothrix brasiliensis 5110 TaxID=1398154 RepID=A0A0C2J4V8_9PEZI|nr:uncharacterized protein SPBR_05652 [Sporothrix brasiliensis 5110]KIH94060.1 hypothetical protein SPBR_05652 [Sporothrix brasiliensis 5110]